MAKKKSKTLENNVIEVTAKPVQDKFIEDDLTESDESSTGEVDLFPVAYDSSVQTGDPQELAQLETEVSIADPLKKYISDIRKTPNLTAEEELALTKKMHENGDLDAAKRLVSANLKIVVRIAYEYRSMYHNLLDLIQEGNMGLMKAVSKFDPTKGARLGYYATWWIRSYILKYLLDNFRLVRVGTSQAQKKLFYHLMREKQRLEAQGITAAPKLLAEKLDVKEKDVIEMEQRMLNPSAEMSLDTPQYSDDPKSTLLNLLVDPHENPDLALERAEWLAILAKAIPELTETLNEKELMILKTRLLSDEPKTLQEVADQFGLTRERVRQLEARILERLKKIVAPHLKS